MLGFISAFDENEKQVDKEKISFVHIQADNDADIKIEMSEPALRFANKFDLKKVYLFYGKDQKIVYDYSL